MKLSTPRSEQGQIVVVAYGWHETRYYMCRYDQSDRTTAWYVADARSAARISLLGYDASASDYPPNVARWTPCDPPEHAPEPIELRRVR